MIMMGSRYGIVVWPCVRARARARYTWAAALTINVAALTRAAGREGALAWPQPPAHPLDPQTWTNAQPQYQPVGGLSRKREREHKHEQEQESSEVPRAWPTQPTSPPSGRSTL